MNGLSLGYFEKHKVDVFFSPDAYLSLRTPVKTVLALHDLSYIHFPEHLPKLTLWYYRFFVPRFVKKASAILTVSNFSKKDIVQHFPISKDKISISYNGASNYYHPLDAAAKQAIKEQYAAGQAYFFYLGAVQPRKNVHRLIEAFDRFKKRTAAPVKLLIGGRFAWNTGPIKSAYDTAEFQSDITFLGYLENEVAGQLMASALALTYISQFEGFGVPLLEAMHAEVPIITSTSSSMPEVAGKAALYADPAIVDQIAIALQQCYENTDLRKQLILEGKKQREKFTWERATDIAAKSLGLS